MQVFFVLSLYLHCQACLLWFYIIEDNLWNHPILSRDVLWQSRFFEDTVYAQYSVSLYESLLGLLGTDI